MKKIRIVLEFNCDEEAIEAAKSAIHCSLRDYYLKRHVKNVSLAMTVDEETVFDQDELDRFKLQISGGRVI